jgi:hypothetical protein
MTLGIKDLLEAHYETHEFPFGRSYQWHPEHIIVECDCGERLTLSASSTTTICWCGTDYSAIISDIQKREGRLSDKVIHPWIHDAQWQAEQHLRDDTTYPKGSPWRYNDITSGNANAV